MSNNLLNTKDIKYIKGVGDFRAKLFANIGIYSINDLMQYFPRSYQARHLDALIRDISEGDFVYIKVNVFSVNELVTKKGLKQLKVMVTDGERFMECVWFTYGKWVTSITKVGSDIWVNGKVGSYNGVLSMSHPQIESAKSEEETLDFWKKRAVFPIYHLTAGLTQNIIRNAIYHSFELNHQFISETLPDYLIQKYGFFDRKTALQKMHFTQNPDNITAVNARFIYEDFLYLQILIAKSGRAKVSVEKTKKHIYSDNAVKPGLIKMLKSNLPFELTNAQRRVSNEIFADMSSDRPMNRLMQGDVGAGKTIVTLFALLLAVENGYQAAFIAPTEILAEQHYKSIKKLLNIIPESMSVSIALIKGGKNKQKTADKVAIAEGRIDLAIGTHALFQRDVEFKNLSLVVIDEQHRFGVRQRSELSMRHGFPDLLYLSATPIPRSLAMTIFGDMSCSTINELPPTRKPVKTILVSDIKRDIAYEQMDSEIKQGRQVYIVCPLISESEKVDLQDAQSLQKTLSTEVFPRYHIALLHGKMKASEKENIMNLFAAGDIQILVSTTVIEVGIDVPNASIMMIEHAERFGLAQLHQLRGRVGRGGDEAFCFLVAHGMSEIGRKRLNTMVKTNDGFVIAEKDLELRGPGDVFGTNQSGLPEFRFANIITDQDWLQKAKIDADLLLDEDPEFALEKHKIIREFYQNNVAGDENLSYF